MRQLKNFEALVLAAGKGTRLNASNIPKVLYRIMGRPLIDYVLDALKQAGFVHPLVVTGFHAKRVETHCAGRARFVRQNKQLGTGHAVQAAQSALKKSARDVLIMFGDMPLVTPKTIRNLAERHQKSGALMTLLSFTPPNPTGYGRILRDAAGRVRGTVEEKLAVEHERAIGECDSGIRCVARAWLASNLAKIQRNATGEYFLTDLTTIAAQEGVKMEVLQAPHWQELVGINTPEQLTLATKLLTGR